MTAPRSLVRLALGLALCQAARASATGLNVSPVQLHLSAEETKTQVTVRNEDPLAAARFQVQVFSWREDPEKGMELGPTQDLVFFPALLSLAPGESRTVRVGVPNAAFGPVEKTYRMFVAELPPAEKEAAPRSQVRVLTRIGIPIFLAALKTVESRSLSLSLGPQGVTADVRNAGNAHVRILDVELHGLDAAGEPLFERRERGWYILAGSHKVYRFEVPKVTCGKVRKLAAVVHTEDEKLISQTLDAPRGACAR